MWRCFSKTSNHVRNKCIIFNSFCFIKTWWYHDFYKWWTLWFFTRNDWYKWWFKSIIKAYGVNYEQIDLIDNEFDEESIVERLQQKNVKLVEIQRSRGYSQRLSLTIDKIESIIHKIREVNQEVIIMVDNCYGELVETKEPGDVGADIVVGSLMKT